MAGVDKITVKYLTDSDNKVVREEGGYTGGTVNVTKNSAKEIGKPVKEDINNNKAENPGSTQFELLEKWTANDRTEYKYDTNSEKVKKSKEAGAKSIKATDKDGNEIGKDEAEEMDKKDQKTIKLGKSMTAIAAAMVGIAVLCCIPYVCLGGGIAYCAGGILATTMAAIYDGQLEKRKAFRDAVKNWNNQTQTKIDAIVEDYERIQADRIARFEEATAAMVENSEAFTAALDEMKATLEQMIADNAPPEQIKAQRDSMVAASASAPLEGELDAMGAIRDEGYDEYYNKIAEIDGMNTAFEPIQKVLANGKKLGQLAIAQGVLALASCLPVAAIAILNALGTTWKGSPFDLPARASVATATAALLGVGCIAFGVAGGMFLKKGKEEFKCAEQGVQLLTKSINPIKQTIAEKTDLDSVLMAKMDALYSDAEAIVTETETQADETVNGGEGEGGEGGGDNGGGGGDNGGGGGGGTSK